MSLHSDHQLSSNVQEWLLEMKATPRKVWIAVLVAALGYFVDIYDLLLFSIVRTASLQDLGLAPSELLSSGVMLMNFQMGGLIVGGLLWGVLGDRRGRLSVLFGSIILYSGANLLNGWVQSLEQYAVLRFVAGVGLAGELGAGITLISEILPKKIRGLGTTLVASFGILGAVWGAWIGEWVHWRTAYLIGGIMGFLILLLRAGVTESGLFQNAMGQPHARGDLRLLLRPHLFSRLCWCVLIGVPIWFVIGILFTLAPEFGTAFEMNPLPTGGRAVMWGYIGLAVGDLTSGVVSQFFQSRKRAIFIYLIFTALGVAAHLSLPTHSLTSFYFFCVWTGIGVGYWAMFVQVAAEQFGTNIRATVTTSAPNFVRGAVIPQTLLFKAWIPHLGIRGSAAAVGILSFLIAFFALRKLEESFSKDLDYLDE